MRSTWAVLEDLANGLPLPAAFTQVRDKVNRDYFGSDYIDSGMKSIRDALAGLPPAMTVDQQTAIGMTRLSPLVGVAEVALATAREHAANQYMSALRDLIGQVMLLLGAIALFAGAVLVVTRRVTVPLQKLSDAMRKLAAGDFAVVLPGLSAKTKSGQWPMPSRNSRCLRLRRPAAKRTSHATSASPGRCAGQGRGRTAEAG